MVGWLWFGENLDSFRGAVRLLMAKSVDERNNWLELLVLIGDDTFVIELIGMGQSFVHYVWSLLCRHLRTFCESLKEGNVVVVCHETLFLRDVVNVFKQLVALSAFKSLHHAVSKVIFVDVLKSAVHRSHLGTDGWFVLHSKFLLQLSFDVMLHL